MQLLGRGETGACGGSGLSPHGFARKQGERGRGTRRPRVEGEMGDNGEKEREGREENMNRPTVTVQACSI